jgi:hypothetical protein
MCGMIAARNHFRREPLSLNRRGRVRRWPHATPRTDTFARAGKSIFLKGSDDGSLTTLRQVHGEDVAS